MKLGPGMTIAGVYFLFKDKALVYVGKSKNIPVRIAEHATSREFDEVHYLECHDEAERTWIENAFIQAVRTPFNTCLPAKAAERRHVEQLQRSAADDQPSSEVGSDQAVKRAGPAPLPPSQPGGEVSRQYTDGDLLTTKEVAAYLRVSERVVEKWRMSGGGPSYIRIGRKAAYRFGDVQQWMAPKRANHHAEELSSRLGREGRGRSAS